MLHRTIIVCIVVLLIVGIAHAQDSIVFDFEDWGNEKLKAGVPFEDWEVIDDIDLGDAGPSTWQARESQLGLDGNVLFQGSNIWGDATDSCLMGTFIIYKGEKLTNFTVEVDVIAADNDGMGLVWAYEDTNKHYRCIMCNDGWPDVPVDGVKGPFMKMAKRISNENPWYELLEAEQGVTYAQGGVLHWTLEVIDGSFTLTREDGKTIEAQDQEYKEGYVGIQLYAQQAEFDNFSITFDAAVEPADKMATAWGAIKEHR